MPSGMIGPVTAALRRARPDDRPLLEAALAEAAAWRDGVTTAISDVIAPPSIAKYVAGWPVTGEAGLLAEGEGACWWRVFEQGQASFGWVADDVGELTIGVLPASRGRGLGRALLRGVIGLAAAEGLPGLSLSVEVDNPAAGLYRSVGFEVIGREAGGAVTMYRPGIRSSVIG